jgi:hypothetical protein
MMNSMTPMNAPAVPPAEFHLLVADSGGLQESAPALEPLIVPSGVSSLHCGMANEFSLSSTSAPAFTHSFRLEPMFSRPNEPRLLLASPPACRASINGVPAPRLTLLMEGDRFHFDAGPAFRVALFHRPRLGPAPAEMIGVACPICTLALAEGDRCFVCPCGTPLHAAEDETREGALACAKMITHCPHCQQPVRLVSGYGELCQPDHD